MREHIYSFSFGAFTEIYVPIRVCAEEVTGWHWLVNRVYLINVDWIQATGSKTRRVLRASLSPPCRRSFSADNLMISKKLCHTLNNNIKHMKLMKQSFSSKMNVVVNMRSRNKSLWHFWFQQIPSSDKLCPRQGCKQYLAHPKPLVTLSQLLELWKYWIQPQITFVCRFC